MEGIVAVTPQVDVQPPGIDIALMHRAEPAQVGLVQVRQRADGLEWLVRRNVEVVGRLVAEHDRDRAAGAHSGVDGPANRTGEIEVRGEQHQAFLRMPDQLQNRVIERVGARS